MKPSETAGPSVRTDVLEAYVFKRTWENDTVFMQLKRAEAPLLDTWQPIIGHAELGESTQVAMWRETYEETRLRRTFDCFAAWALEGVHPYYLARSDAVMMSPRFAIEVEPNWKPILNEENSAARWVKSHDVNLEFMWPGQRAAIAEIMFTIVGRSIAEPHLRI